MSKLFASAALLSLTLGAIPACAQSSGELVYFGSHGVQSGGPPPGAAGQAGGPAGGQATGGPPRNMGPRGPQKPVDIYAAHFDADTGKLSMIGVVGQLTRPTWFAINQDKSVLYSDNETGPGQIDAFKIDPSTAQLTKISQIALPGEGTTYVSYDPTLQTVFGSNFNTGHVAAVPVKSDGSLGPVSSYQLDYGHGPHPRQKGPHAHAVITDPSHHYVLVPDMGADRVFIYKFKASTRKLSPNNPPFIQFPPGTGPRHAVFDPSGKYLYVMTELSATIHAFDWDEKTGRATPIQIVQTMPGSNSDDKDGSEVAVSKDGKFLYSATRLDNSIDVYAIDPATGTLNQIQQISAQGEKPWSFTIDPSGRWMLINDEGSNKVAELKIDPATGKLSETGESVTMPHPVNASFVGG